MSIAFQQNAFQEGAFQIDARVAVMQNRAGIARAGATRAGHYTHSTVILINGVNRTTAILPESVRISQYLNDEVDRARFTIKPNVFFAPVAGQSITIGLGTATNAEFGGQVVAVTHRRVKTATGLSVFYDVDCVDYGRLFDRRLVTQAWYATTIHQIAFDVIDNYTTGFTRNSIATDLDVIDYFPATNARPSELLRRLANLASGGFYVDPARDVHLFGSGGEPNTSSPLTLSNSQASIKGPFFHDGTVAQVRTRVIVEGKGTQTRAVVDVGDTIIPVEDATIFDPFGGDAVVDQQLLTYTGTVVGGAGSLVGPGVAPPTFPIPTASSGAGLGQGLYIYAYTWVTGAGETLASPLNGIVTGPIAGPSTAPTRTVAAGSGLGAGTYLYAVTFTAASGETTAGPVGSVVTSDGIDPPGASPSATSSWFPGETHTGGRYVIGDSVYCRCSYIDASGNETGGTDSNTVAVASFGGTPASVLFSNLPSPSDPRVVNKRLYLNVNGSFVAYKELAAGQFADSWYNAGTSVGAFPIGGDPELRRVSLTSIPLGQTGVTARKIYRTTVGGSTLKLLTTLADNTTTTYTDSTADGSLGADVPSTNTTSFNQVALTAIGVGPATVTARKVYRTEVGGTDLKLLTTLADNTTTTYADSTADSGLGADDPAGDTSGLEQENGQVNAGETELIVAGPGAFSAAGGWAVVANQVIRYTGISGQTLTGIPASGAGSLGATVSYGATISESPRLTGVGGVVTAIEQGASVRLRVVANDFTAQAVMAAIEGGDGIHEYPIVDSRLTLLGAQLRALSELAVFSAELTEAEWTTQDLNAKPGRAQTIAFSGTDAVSTTLTIQSVELDFRVASQRPFRTCRAGTVKPAGFLDAVTVEN